jgi:hypothetical protein
VFQQNLGSSKLAVIVLQGRTSRLVDMKLLMPNLLSAIERAVAGTATTVSE